MQGTSKIRILVIDDDPLMQELCCLGLKTRGFEVEIAQNGQEAILILERDSGFDRILVDLMMPVMDGLRFLRWLRQEAKLAIPTLVLTGKSGSSTRDEVFAAGGNDILFKPVSLPTIDKHLRQLGTSQV